MIYLSFNEAEDLYRWHHRKGGGGCPPSNNEGACPVAAAYFRLRSARFVRRTA